MKRDEVNTLDTWFDSQLSILNKIHVVKERFEKKQIFFAACLD
jgi:hypothetical protein